MHGVVRRLGRAGVAAVCALLLGCGGGGGGDAPSTGSTSGSSGSGNGSGGNNNSNNNTNNSSVTILPLSTAAPTPAVAASAVILSSQPNGTRTIGIPIPANSYPAKGSSLSDPATGFTVTRVADKSELTGDYNGTQSDISAIVYSRYTPVNTTGEYVLVHGANSTSAWIYRVADNKMMTVLRFKPSLGQASRALGELNELRWDYSGNHPYRLYFVGRALPDSQAVAGENVGMSFYYLDFDPANGSHAAPVLVRDFSADFPGFASNAEIMNDVEGDSSNDSRYWAWQVMNTAVSGTALTYAVFSYDKTSNAILGRLQRDCTGAPTPCVAINTPATALPYLSRPNMVEMSPLGTRVIVDFNRAYSGNFGADVGSVADGPKAFLPNFSDPIRIGSDATHSGWAWGLNGEELFVSQNNRNDWIEAVDIQNASTANCQLIADNSYGCGSKLVRQQDLAPDFNIGYHFGKFYDRNKRGFVYMNTYNDSNNAWGKNQGLLVGIRDGSAPAGPLIVRLGSTYNVSYDYRSEGSGALDFAGNNIWATANWGINGRGDVIRLQLPPNLFSVLPAP